jgi:hypothetical protein
LLDDTNQNREVTFASREHTGGNAPKLTVS